MELIFFVNIFPWFFIKYTLYGTLVKCWKYGTFDFKELFVVTKKFLKVKFDCITYQLNSLVVSLRFRTWNLKIIFALVHIRAFKLLWSMLRGFKQHSEFSGHQHMCAKVCAYNRVWFAYESSDSWAVGNKKLHKLTSNLHM